MSNGKTLFGARAPCRDISVTKTTLAMEISINVIQTEDDHVLHGYDGEACPRIDQIKDELLASAEYQTRQAQWASTVLLNISNALGTKVSTISSASSLHTALECDMYNGYASPNGLTEDMFLQLGVIHGFQKFFIPFNSTEALKLSCSSFFQILMGNIKQSLSGGSLKFAYFSAHDTTLAAFLSCLDLVQEYNPPFASTLVFEVYDNSTIALKYNDNILDIPGCTQTPCDVNEFYTILNSLYVPNLEAACQLQ